MKDFSNEPSMVLSADAFVEHRLQLRQKGPGCFHMAQARIAFYHYKHPKPVQLPGWVYIRLARKMGDGGYTLPKLSSLSPVKMGHSTSLRKCA